MLRQIHKGTHPAKDTHHSLVSLCLPYFPSLQTPTAPNQIGKKYRKHPKLNPPPNTFLSVLSTEMCKHSYTKETKLVITRGKEEEVGRGVRRKWERVREKERERESEGKSGVGGGGYVFVPGAKFGKTRLGNAFIHIFHPFSWEPEKQTATGWETEKDGRRCMWEQTGDTKDISCVL